MMLAMPGGVKALENVTRRLHAKGVKVLWPYKPWDKGTRRDARGDVGQMQAVLSATGADGINGDTMPWVPEEFYQASVDAGRPVAIEPELGGVEYDRSNKNSWLNWHTQSWGYWTYPHAPLVDRWKWFDTRHMTHVWYARRLEPPASELRGRPIGRAAILGPVLTHLLTPRLTG